MRVPEEDKTVESVVASGLCTGCGTCAVICPGSAVRMEMDARHLVYLPLVDDNLCNDCGLCREVCPRAISGTNHKCSSGQEATSGTRLGAFHVCYLGRAADSEIRYNASSGGLVTALLLNALDTGLIDGALVTRMGRDNPLVPEPFIARTAQDIREAMGSKYCPVPANVALREILKTDGRYAIVGLPCHIQAVRKAQEVSQLLAERVVLCLGIFCSHTLSFAATEFLLKKLRIDNSRVTSLSYRGQGWPGGMSIKLSDGDSMFRSNFDPLWTMIFGGFFFTPRYCLFCEDVTAELADLSFGDPWLPDIIRSEKAGVSVVISRTEAGERLLRDAGLKGAVNLEPFEAAKVVTSQRLFLHFKKDHIGWRRAWPRLPGCSTPGWGQRIHGWLLATLLFMNGRVGRWKPAIFVLRLLPSRLVALYLHLTIHRAMRLVSRTISPQRKRN